MGTVWDGPAGVAERVRDLGEWYHNMEIGGVHTAPGHSLGDYPAVKWRHFAHAIPADLRGMTVLDVGCNAGFYSIEMKRRGADLVVGIDTEDRYLAQAGFAAQQFGVDIELRKLSVYDVAALGRSFDLVLFLGMLYHLRHPLLALDLLREYAVSDLLVFQSLMRGSAASGAIDDDYPFEESEVFDQPEWPRLHFVEARYAADAATWWIPNRACAEAMLRSAGFSIVDRPEAEVLVCRRSAIPDGEPRAVHAATKRV